MVKSERRLDVGRLHWHLRQNVHLVLGMLRKWKRSRNILFRESCLLLLGGVYRDSVRSMMRVHGCVVVRGRHLVMYVLRRRVWRRWHV